MIHSSSSSSTTTTISTTFLCLLAARASIPFVSAAEITAEDLFAKINPTAAAPGFNVEGGSVFTNLAKTLNEGQLFLIRTQSFAFERPDSDPVQTALLGWCSDLSFSDISNSSLIGYAGRCVDAFLAGGGNAEAAGAQLPFDHLGGDFTFTSGISAVFVEQQNVFEGQLHMNADDSTWRFWDSGRKTMPTIAWEGHDEGDMSSNAATSSFSAFGEFTWLSADEVAQLFNTSVDEFTPEKFKQVYLNTWIKDHEEEAAEMNPNPEPELEIIEQVKNETNYVDDTAITTAVQPSSTAEEGGSDSANPVVEDDSDSGSERQLMSVAARFVSAALRVFGI